MLRFFASWFLALSMFGFGGASAALAVDGQCEFQCRRADGTTETTRIPSPDAAGCARACSACSLISGQTCVEGSQRFTPPPTEAGATKTAESETKTAESETKTPDSGSKKRGDGLYGLRDPLGNITIQRALGRVVRYAVGFSGALFLAYFIYGGLLWMTAGGSTEKVVKARKALINSAIGIAIIIFSYAIIAFILGFTETITGGS